MHVQNSPRDGRPGGHFDGFDVLRQRGQSGTDDLPGCRWIVTIVFSILGEQLCQQLLFERVRDARNGQSKRKSDPLPIAMAPFAEHPFGKHSSCLDKCRIVQQCQSGKRCIGTGPLSRAFFAARRVQGLEHRVQELPLPVYVDTTSPLALIGVVPGNVVRGNSGDDSILRAGTD